MIDPIFAAIDDHKRLRAAHLAALAEGDGAAACDAEISAWDKLLATTPTTLAGVSAMLAYVAEWQGQDDAAYADPDDLLTAIRSAAAAGQGGY